MLLYALKLYDNKRIAKEHIFFRRLKRNTVVQYFANYIF